MVKLTEEQKRGNPLRVTRGDGVPLEDQAAAIEALKRQCRDPGNEQEAISRVSWALDFPIAGTNFKDGRPRVQLLCSDVALLLEKLDRTTAK